MSKSTKLRMSLGVAFLIVGIPIAINEFYKADCGYITVWDGAVVLGYYGTILASIVTVISIFVTITFTKKQIQRDTFLKNENEKWNRLRLIFLQIINNINPILVLKDIIDNGLSNPEKAAVVLQRYQMDCKIASDLLNAHLNMDEYPKFKKLIDSITTTAEGFVNISQKAIEQYSNLRLLELEDMAVNVIKAEEEYPGFFSKEHLAFCKDVLEKVKATSFEDINRQITQINTEFIQEYEEKYRTLLQLTGATFETIAKETQRQADNMLSFDKVYCRK